MNPDLEQRVRADLHAYVDHTTRGVRRPAVAAIAARATRARRRRRIEVGVAGVIAAVVLGVGAVAIVGQDRTHPVADGGGPVLFPPPPTTTNEPRASTTTVVANAPITTPPGAEPMWFYLGDGAELAWVAEPAGTRYWTRSPQTTAARGPLEGTVDSLVVPLENSSVLIVVFGSPGRPRPATASVAVAGAEPQTVALAWRADVDLATARVASAGTAINPQDVVVSVG